MKKPEPRFENRRSPVQKQQKFVLKTIEERGKNNRSLFQEKRKDSALSPSCGKGHCCFYQT
ncbi:MAG: hypothetical protein HG422_03225 [Prevotella sp.]|nr:hypothetical protein [Prevotella sp.]